MMAVKFFFVVRLAVCMNSPPWDLFSGQQPFPTNQHGFHGLLFIPCVALTIKRVWYGGIIEELLFSASLLVVDLNSQVSMLCYSCLISFVHAKKPTKYGSAC